MLSSDRGRTSRLGVSAWLVAAALGLAACTIQPVYGPAVGGGTVKANLSRIAIDPVDDRVSQVVRNKLLFQLTGGGEEHDPIYRMHLTVTHREVALGITSIESAPVYSVSVAASYELKRIDTGEIVLRSTSRASTSYNTVNQAFANSRAKIDAQDRAATQAANDIATRVAAAVATGT
jgi:LPS-assembly lipoprotein